MSTIIAEFCQNHGGDRGQLAEMIAAAAEAGADFAKIQTIFADEVSFRPRFEEGIFEGGETRAIRRPYGAEVDRLRGLELSWDDMAWFVDACRAKNIRALTTAFTRAQVTRLSEMQWDAIKIASYDCASFPLLREVAARFKHVYVSTGATFDDEIATAADLLKAAGVGYSMLHCVTIYPTPLDQLHLARMNWLRQFAPEVGFSDHSRVEDGIKASAVALLQGAQVIERHFTLRKPGETRDGPVSMTEDQLATLCRLAHGSVDDVRRYVDAEVGNYSAMIGDERRGLSRVELLNRDYYRGRFASKLADGSPVFNWQSDSLS